MKSFVSVTLWFGINWSLCTLTVYCLSKNIQQMLYLAKYPQAMTLASSVCLFFTFLLNRKSKLCHWKRIILNYIRIWISLLGDLLPDLLVAHLSSDLLKSRDFVYSPSLFFYPNMLLSLQSLSGFHWSNPSFKSQKSTPRHWNQTGTSNSAQFISLVWWVYPERAVKKAHFY